MDYNSVCTLQLGWGFSVRFFIENLLTKLVKMDFIVYFCYKNGVSLKLFDTNALIVPVLNILFLFLWHLYKNKDDNIHK